MNGRRLELPSELYTADMAAAARRWIGPFRKAFPDVHMEIVTLVAEVIPSPPAAASRLDCAANLLHRRR